MKRGKHMNLKQIRKQIDELDDDIVKSIAARFTLVKKLRIEKGKQQVSVQDKNREREIIDRLQNHFADSNISRIFIGKLFKLIFTESKRLQK
ncbi:hypothetical protein A2773_00910 [Candidatus Gottesmanbacteria bacterium RIFCSPHIGHO2_01_FULL_39_10]|uniref:Chorismate mutase domain-containing protein n=1 Tax=Candidatus Gottesmanbacteria bacterium RIFCSPHIGHO2_01_FULL_39_10 TaxID=1798375 RepID=A0A1F5ZLI2_9BACT|nr:MAG: hypothetical protein A2773_00910 [Candidatus Gottesmanbacteria bacterium RIFCSPHIGHO2_01_FULL_39_10]